jgi:hypothetical protein
MGFQEGPGEIATRIWDALGAVVHHHFMAVVEPEGLAGEEPLLIAGEANGIGTPQGGIDGPGPYEPFLEVFEGIAVAKPGIQHPVGNTRTGVEVPRTAR